MLAEGKIAPDVLLIDNPAVELYTPPAVPLRVTERADMDVQNGLPEYDILVDWLGAAPIVTEVVAFTAAQPPDAAIVYVTVYVPTVEVDGIIAPVVELMLKPVVDENKPPEVPVTVAVWGVDTELQNEELLYEIVAIGIAVIATVAVVVYCGHIPAAAMVYVTT